MSTIESSPQNTFFRDPTQYTDAHFFGTEAVSVPALLVNGVKSAAEIVDAEIVEDFTYDEYSATLDDNDAAVENADGAFDLAAKKLPILLDQLDSDKKQLNTLNGRMIANYEEKTRIEDVDRELVGEMISATERKSELEARIAEQKAVLASTEEEMEPEEAKFQQCQKDVDDGKVLGTDNMTPDERRTYMQSWDTLNTPNDFLHKHTRLTHEIAALKALLGQLIDTDLHGLNESMQNNLNTHKQNALRLAELDTEMQELMFQCRGVRERVKTVDKILSSLAGAIEKEFGESMMRVGLELEQSDETDC